MDNGTYVAMHHNKGFFPIQNHAGWPKFAQLFRKLKSHPLEKKFNVVLPSKNVPIPVHTLELLINSLKAKEVEDRWNNAEVRTHTTAQAEREAIWKQEGTTRFFKQISSKHYWIQ
jgi:hypothetical protein